MRAPTRRAIVAGVATVALVIGVGAAFAAGDDDGDLKRAAKHLTGKSAFEAAVAKELGTTVAKLNAAYEAAALSRIAAAEKADEITATEADALENAVEDGWLAKRIALPADVAKELGTTEEKLNAAYAAAKKAELKARVDQAVADKIITPEYGEQLKKQIDEADFTGSRNGKGLGHRRHGPGPGFLPGLGPGPGFGFGFGRGSVPPGGTAPEPAPASLVF
jgi:hypothetical protein